MKATCLLVLVLVGVVFAQNPRVNGGTTALTQNHGYVTFTGVGFETDDPTSGNAGQFRFGVLENNFQPGCMDGTMTISANGSHMTCMFIYIPDGAIAVGGSPLILTVVNNNGASLPTQVRLVTAVPDSVTACAGDPCPLMVNTAATGVCFSGTGFPARGSIPRLAVNNKVVATLVLDLRDDAGNNVNRDVHDATLCVYSKTNICCRIPSIAGFQTTDSLSASLLYTSGAHLTNTAGSVIATLTNAAVTAPVLAAIPATRQNQRLLTLTGSGFATSVSLWSNVIALGNGRTCTPLEVNNAGTQLICSIYRGYTMNAADFAAPATVTVNGVASNAVTPAAATAVTQRIIADNQQILRTGGVLRVPVQGFPPQFRTFGVATQRELIDAAADLTVNFADDAAAIAAVSCIVQPAGTSGTNSHLPLVSEVATADSCRITDVGENFIEVTYGSSFFQTFPVGTQITASTPAGAHVGAIGAVVIGTITASGVGGDPHFFGFLGERYEFAGEAGQVYNVLTDEHVQINAMIGQWHYNRGKETIIRSLAIKAGGHSVVIDAGGNHLGAPGFSVQLDGKVISPNATERYSLGAAGYVRWYELTTEFKVPIWTNHHAVAKVDVVLTDYALEVFGVEEGKDAQGVWHQQPSRFLDFLCDMFDNTRRPHGLFGQSAHLPRGKRSIEGWSIEGEAADYRVKDNSLLGDDFTFNKFKQ